MELETGDIPRLTAVKVNKKESQLHLIYLSLTDPT